MRQGACRAPQRGAPMAAASPPAQAATNTPSHHHPTTHRMLAKSFALRSATTAKRSGRTCAGGAVGGGRWVQWERVSWRLAGARSGSSGGRRKQQRLAPCAALLSRGPPRSRSALGPAPPAVVRGQQQGQEIGQQRQAGVAHVLHSREPGRRPHLAPHVPPSRARPCLVHRATAAACTAPRPSRIQAVAPRPWRTKGSSRAAAQGRRGAAQEAAGCPNSAPDRAGPA